MLLTNRDDLYLLLRQATKTSGELQTNLQALTSQLGGDWWPVFFSDSFILITLWLVNKLSPNSGYKWRWKKEFFSPPEPNPIVRATITTDISLQKWITIETRLILSNMWTSVIQTESSSATCWFEQLDMSSEEVSVRTDWVVTYCKMPFQCLVGRRNKSMKNHKSRWPIY